MFKCVQIQQLTGVIHTGGDEEISCVIELAAPNRLLVLFKGVATRGVQEIPNLDRAVAGGGGQMGPPWVEGDARNPVLVALT